MDSSSDFNLDDILSFDKAVLIARSRVNALGTQDLTIDYNNVTSKVKEFCIDYLEANRLEITDPHVSFKTYEGTYKCISISYNENIKAIRQVFKIDGESDDWNLGDIEDEPIFENQIGDLVRISDGMQAFRGYYWKVSDPTEFVLPTAPIEGEIWTKTANDNGDGTYDVIISKEVAQDLEAKDYSESGSYSESSETHTNTLPYVFASSYQGDPLLEVSEPDAVIGTIKKIDNSPLENGLFRSKVTTRTAIPQRIPATSEGPPGYIAWPSDYSDAGGSFSADGGRLIVGRNQFIADFYSDIALLDGRFINSVSSSINDYGLIDYSIRSTI